MRINNETDVVLPVMGLFTCCILPCIMVTFVIVAYIVS